MQDTLVSARMPQAKKERARGALAAIGATTSDLINSAFDYVIAMGQLPAATAPEAHAEDELAAFVEASSVEVDWPENTGDYKSLAKQMRLADYESLA